MYHAGLYKPFPWTGEAVRKINDSGYKAILITNQAGVGRGYFPESMVHEVHSVLDAELNRWSAHLDGIYYCPHQSGNAMRLPQTKAGYDSSSEP